MKKLLSIIALFFAVYSLNAQVEPLDTDGNGYRNISTLDHLRWFSENDSSWSWNFELDNDIDAGDTRNWNEGEGWHTIGNENIRFRGKFYGRGYVIDSLFINQPNQLFVGFIGFTMGDSCEIKYLGVTNCNISAASYTGAVAGRIFSGSSINQCYSSGIVKAHSIVGGLVGENNSNSLINNCFSSCLVLGSYSSSGGLVGTNNYNAIVNNSYSIGLVKGNGGLIGNNINSSVITNSFWDTQTSTIDSSAGGIGKTTAQMKTKSTFTDADWDFENIWSIDPKINQGYPYLEAVPVSVLEAYISEKNNISIYPNPITKGNILNITSEKIMNNSILDFSIKIYNMEGVLVAKNQNSQNLLISNDFSIGTYFLLIESDGKIIGSEKFIVE